MTTACSSLPRSAPRRPVRVDPHGAFYIFKREWPIRCTLLAALAIALAGCGLTPKEPIASGGDRAGACRALVDAVDAAVDRADVADAGAARIEGFPWLRVTRPLASFRDAVTDEARFEAWVDRLAAQAEQGRRHELANLPQGARQRLAARWRSSAQRHGLPKTVDTALTTCRAVLRRSVLADSQARDHLRQAATVPDAYNTWQRFFGFYAIAWRVARAQVEDLHAERTEVFARETPDDPAIERYAVPTRDVAAPEQLARDITRDALGIPQPQPTTRAQLFAAHAPVWAIETRSDADRPGVLKLDAEDRPYADTGKPVEYRRLSWTRFQGDILLQLTYQLWFPERPSQQWLDPYAGHLDGIIWRVTLGPSGEPIAYDSIHPCGCYYHLLPAEGWQRRPVADDQEPVLSPITVSPPGPAERTVVTVEASTHYLRAVETAPQPAKGQMLAPLQTQRLRSLPRAEGGSASAYAQDGLIPSSARLERFFLWPLGVPSAGAMRQWGHHAIAFVGRRHFDDPDLLEPLLEREPAIEGSD